MIPIRIIRSVVVHLVPHLLLDRLQNSRINKLGEGVQLLLMKQRHKVVAEPPHLALPVKERVLHYAAPRAVNVPLLLNSLLDPLLLCDGLSKRPFADALLEKHDDESPLLVVGGFVGARSEEDGHLVAFEHHVRKEELEAVLEVVFFGVVLLLVGLFVDTHVGSLH